MAAPVYSVTLHNLSPDAKVANLSYTDEQLLGVSIDQLRELLYSLSELAARLTIYEPAMPEVRIKTERDIYIVRTRYRRLCFVGWEQMLRGEEHTVAYILSTITGTVEPVKAAPKPVERPATAASTPVSSKQEESGTMSRSTKIAIMAVLIVVCNATAVWMLLKPSKKPAPEFVLLSAFESQALLTKVAGEYETGGQEGDRRLVIDSDGTLHLAKYGRNRAILDETTKTSRGGLSEGRTVLVTGDPYLVAIKDADHVVLYGNTYRRHNR